jgi:hypothetical protein
MGRIRVLRRKSKDSVLRWAVETKTFHITQTQDGVWFLTKRSGDDEDWWLWDDRLWDVLFS